MKSKVLKGIADNTNLYEVDIQSVENLVATCNSNKVFSIENSIYADIAIKLLKVTHEFKTVYQVNVKEIFTETEKDYLFDLSVKLFGHGIFNYSDTKLTFTAETAKVIGLYVLTTIDLYNIGSFIFEGNNGNVVHFILMNLPEEWHNTKDFMELAI